MREVKPTQKPVPSSDIKDLFFNSGLLDIWATSLEHKYIDRFGNCHLTAAGMEWIFNELVTKFKIESEQALLAAGYAPTGTFQEGAEVVSRNGTVLWKLPDGDGDHYRWDGELPKQVPVDSTPESTGGISKGAWVSVGDASLRGDLRKNDGSKIIGYDSEIEYPENSVGFNIGNYTATGATQKIKREDRARRVLSTSDFSDDNVDIGNSANQVIASLATEYSDSASNLIRGGVVNLPRGTYASKTPINIEKHRGGSGSISLVGQGQQTSAIDMSGETGQKDGVTGGELGAVFGELKDFSVQNTPRNGIRIAQNSRLSLTNVSVDKNTNEGMVLGNGFVNVLTKVIAKGNGGAGIRFDESVEHNAHVINSGYAIQNAGSGWVLGQFHYSVMNGVASDQNGFYGYDIQKTDGLVMNGCGTESNGRSGYFVSSSSAKGETDNLEINGAWANMNNLTQSGYPNLLLVRAADGKKAKVTIKNSRSLPLNGEVIPCIIAEGDGAEVTIENCNIPNGAVSRNGGYLRIVSETLLVKNKLVPKNTGTSICKLRSPQGHARFNGLLTIVVGNNSPDTENRNTAIYHIMISKSIQLGYQVIEIAKAGHVNGGSATSPSFKFSIVSDQLVATPVDSLTGDTNFWFEIDTESQILAYA